MSGQLVCEACGAVDVERDESVGLAHCRFCEHVFALPAQTPPGGETKADEAALDSAFAQLNELPRAAAALEVPATITTREQGDALVLEVSWFNYGAIPLLLFSLLWNGMLFAFYATAIIGGLGPEVLMTMLFTSIHLAVGVALGYSSVAQLVNRTTVKVDRQGLHVRHGPMPWWGARDIPVDDIRQLFVVERIIRNKNNVRYVYDLKAQVARGADLKLLSGVSDASAAQYVERRVEGWLGIVNVAVDGEHV